MNRAMIRRCNHRRRGAAAVEMAIASIVLFSVLMGGWEMSRVAMLRHSADYAAYVATRSAIIVGHQHGDAIADAQRYLSDRGIRDAVITIDPSPLLESTEHVHARVEIPIARNSWVTPRFFDRLLVGDCQMQTERTAMSMRQSVISRPPPPPPTGGGSGSGGSGSGDSGSGDSGSGGSGSGGSGSGGSGSGGSGSGGSGSGGSGSGGSGSGGGSQPSGPPPPPPRPPSR